MSDDEPGRPFKPASLHTCAANSGVARQFDLADASSFEDARRGFIATIPDALVLGANGRPVWSLEAYRFLEEATAPDTVNPSLWRQARVNCIHGLFEVVPRMFQVRGFDIANLTIIEGDTGLILIDPLTFAESARTALDLYYTHRDPGRTRPVRAVIYSHSHGDHYGGVEGVMSAAQGASGEVQVIAPTGFMEAAIAENVLAGIPMRRRSMFQFGQLLERHARAQVDAGLGKTMGRGTMGLIAPNMVIERPIETHVIDGVEIEFQLTPETEAPAEMNFFFPGMGVLNLAENGCHTMHNLCPIRGAKTRDALAWSKYLGYALDHYVERTDVVIAQHHWPTWGRDKARAFVSEQRDLYRHMHDQTLRLMAHGMTPHEVAAEYALPAGLARRWHARPYYGATAHNVRAVYAHYLGPYDGNPVNLNPYAPVEAGQRYVEYMGGADALLARARADYERGDYRWVVQVTHHLVFADPANRAARSLAADAMEQLAYQAESSTWRNAYVLGAKELREGPPKPPPGGVGVITPQIVAMLPMELFFDFLAVRVNGPKAEALSLKIDWHMSDENRTWRLTLSNGALSNSAGSHGDAAQATVQMNRAALAKLVGGGAQFAAALAAGELRVAGDASRLAALLGVLDNFNPMFAIVEP
ncbi:MAG: MBL fold metallo-hydrolase [Burkholderiales bacterium]|nr:MBL fold metallo-hydrolase [Burkholderiales bacterium]